MRVAKSLISSCLPLFVALTAAAEVTEDVVVVVTPPPHYVTVTVSPDIETKDITTTISTTIYQATTTPVTSVSGTVFTTITTISQPPVTQAVSYSTTKRTKTYNPSTFSSGIVITTTSESLATVVTSSSASSIATSSSASNVATSGVATSSIASSITKDVATDETLVVAAPSTLVTLTSGSEPSSFSSTSFVPVSSTQPASSNDDNNYYYSNGPIFGAIDTAEPPSVFSREDLDISVPDGLEQNGDPIETNKFHANLFLSTQKFPVYTRPYSVWWSNNTDYYGLGISHDNFSQRVFGPDPDANPVEYYINPVGLMSMVLSAVEFSPSNMDLGIYSPDVFSVNATLSAENGTITFPFVMGQGLITAEYSGLTPIIFSQLGFKTVTLAQGQVASNIQKYVATLFTGDIWVIYAILPSGGSFDSTFELEVENDYHIQANSQVDGLILQVGIVPTGAEDDFDSVAGAYPVSASVDASVTDDVGTYTISYDVQGSSKSGNIWIWAYPHVVESLSSSMSGALTNFTIDSLTKGLMTGVISTKLEMSEKLYTDIQYLPWSSNSTFTGPSYSSEALKLMANVSNSEMSQNILDLVEDASLYTAGKIYDKFAYILLVAKDILKDDSVTEDFLKTLQQAFTLYTSNEQNIPLMYDTLFKGVTSSGAQNGGDSMTDYGNPYYNDHHFQYGYFVHAAAIIGYVDNYFNGTWVEDNKDWVNSLVRDVANPSKDDNYFPVFRMFDWFSGHSWAAGLFASADGKNEESTSEDVNFAYGMKLWGKIIGDKEMEARGDLMLAVLKRALGLYVLMEDDNTIQPSNYIANKVAGITFENKLDHTTYFGTKLQYIQGIQMIPITPASGLTRNPTFVQQEWEDKLASIIDDLDSGWAGILRSDQALFDPIGAYDWFSQSDFQQEWLDDGASRTWYLALSAGLGGSPA